MKDASKSTTGAVVWRDPKVKPVKWQLELGKVCDELIDSVKNKRGMRVNLSAPPRHGKTEYVGRAMPLRAMLSSDRPLSFLYVTASDERAEEVSGRVRKAVEKIYLETGDERFKPGRKWGTSEWETEYGFSWKGIGWSAATGGIGCDFLIMDDLIGTSETYRSPAKRNRIQRVIQEDLLSRIMDGGAAVHMETRRGTLDTTQWILDNYGVVWRSVVWKCFDEELGYLWPEVYGEAWRETMPHLTESSSIWLSLYQQEPVEEGATLIQYDWLQAEYHESPEVARALSSRVVIGVDLANTAKETSDPVCFVVMGIRGAYLDVLHVVHKRCAFPEQKTILKDLSNTWKPNHILVEKAAGGHQIIDDLKGSVPNLDGQSPVGDKVTRLTPHLGRFASGQVRVPRGVAWVGPWREELMAFTGVAGRKDNQVDATVWAMNAAEIKKGGIDVRKALNQYMRM